MLTDPESETRATAGCGVQGNPGTGHSPHEVPAVESQDASQGDSGPPSVERPLAGPLSAEHVGTLTGWRGEAKLWKLSQVQDLDSPLWGYFTYQHVVTSAINTGYAHETYVFPTDPGGKVLSWGELPGSYRGDTDHQRALDGFLAQA